jgi:hypothetical protein
MIGGGGHYPQALGMETSSHGHGGSITEDFVRVPWDQAVEQSADWIV